MPRHGCAGCIIVAWNAGRPIGNFRRYMAVAGIQNRLETSNERWPRPGNIDTEELTIACAIVVECTAACLIAALDHVVIVSTAAALRVILCTASLGLHKDSLLKTIHKSWPWP